MSKVDAHWELIEAIKTLRDEIAPNTLLTINGDIPIDKLVQNSQINMVLMAL